MRRDFTRRVDDEAGPSDYDEENDEDDIGEDDGDARDEQTEDEDGGEILAAADPAAVDAFRDLLAAVLSALDNEEEDLLRVAARADVETLNPDEMAPDELARLTYELAGSYPDALEAVTNRFPHAERLLVAVLGGEPTLQADQDDYAAQ